jgi:hypothetical protein
MLDAGGPLHRVVMLHKKVKEEYEIALLIAFSECRLQEALNSRGLEVAQSNITWKNYDNVRK